MKKLLIAFAAISLGSTAAYAADMDCCKDCKCCEGMKEGKEQPAPAPKPQ